MRLTEFQRQTIKAAVFNVIDTDSRIWLFGSRADDSRRGGDIDIYFEASRPIDLKTTLALEYRLTSLCNAKVDLLIRRPGEVEKPIHVIARQGAPL